jgi:hypothetical protein
MLDGLPTLYEGLLPDVFRRELPAETKATCASCAMCASSGRNLVESVDGVSRLFRPDTKCCTYHPRLPNYLVGALLADGSAEMAEGRRRIREKIERRIGITPQWVKPPAKYELLYQNARQAFGRSPSLLCPYYEKQQGSCTLWAYREAVCSTFFCKYVAGADGRKLWMTLKTWLSLAEIHLSRYAVLQLYPDFLLDGRGRTAPTAGVLTAEELDDSPPRAREYAALWGDRVGHEAEFYQSCFELVRSLSAADLERFLGLDGTIELAILERLHQVAVSPGLPKVLAFNPDATVKWLPDGSVALGAYNEYDAVALPGAAYGLLVEFTGREPVQAVRQRLREEKQADLHEDILLELYRHRILVDPSVQDSART